MAEHERSAADSQPERASDLERWRLVLPHRDDLVRYARILGAGPDSEDVVHEALLAAARYEQLDGLYVWGLLAKITARRIADRYRRAARAEMLVRHRGLVPQPRHFDDEVLDRAEAEWVAEQLVQLLQPDILDILWSHHVSGATWAQLAAQRSTTADALKKRVSRALRSARSDIQTLLHIRT